jgi:D-serine deaminase-like pyridoxal phosphate-dependent protein
VAQAARLADRPVDVLVEVDSGFHRTGLPPGPDVVELATAIGQTPHLRFQGLMAYAGHIAGETDPERIRRIVQDEDTLLGEQVAQLRRAGLEVTTVSVGGTVLSQHLDLLHHATEVRPGMYVFNDMGIVERGAATVADCALRVVTTVVSRPAPGRAVLDAGSKTLSTDGPVRGSYGYVVEHPAWRVARLSEEHAVVETGPDDAAAIGELVHVIPNHVCTVVNLHDRLVAVRQGRVEALWPVVARGRVR